MREALKRMVKIAMRCKELDKMHVALGYENTPYFDLYGDAVDAIYFLVGEHTNTLEESVTYCVLNDPDLLDEERVEKLLEAAKGNCDVTVNIPNSTLKTVQDCASVRQMDYQTLLRLIVSEWALHHECTKAAIAHS